MRTVERVCFFTNYNQYESKRHFALELSKALEARGIETKIFDFEDPLFRQMPKFWMEEFSPDLSISFNSFVRDDEGLFTFERFQVPNLSILVDPALYYTEMADSPLSILSVVDLFDIDVLKGFGNDKVFFLPHGAPKDLANEPEEEKIYDAVFIGSCYDYISLQHHFRRTLTPAQVNILESASAIFLNDNHTPLQVALAEAVNRAGAFPENTDFMQMFRMLDIYTRGLDRIQLLRNLKDINVHIFGATNEGDLYPTRGWKDYFADMPNITVHDPVNYQESLNILKKSKISLNSSPFFKNGSHERLFVPPLLGALAVSNDTLYTRRTFVDGEDIILYPPEGWEQMNERLKIVLKDEDKRRSMVSLAKKNILENHTWDARAKTILKEVPPLLKKINVV